MTTATSAVSAVSTGRAPGGMWWVAWRQHRIQLAIAVGLMAVGAVIMAIFRAKLVAALTAAGCEGSLHGQMACILPDGIELWRSGGFSYDFWYSQITAGAIGTPLVLGVFLGAVIFPREFEQGTHVYALAQSVSRARWWAIKVTVVGVPLVVGLLALGLVKEWLDASSMYTAYHSMDTTAFATRSVIPAAFGLLVFAFAVAVGIFTRRTVVALVLSLVIGFGVMIALLSPLRAHLVPADRYTNPVVEQYTGTYLSTDPNFGDRDALFTGSGYLDKDGHDVGYRPASQCTTVAYEWDPALSDQENSDRSQQAWNDCLTDHGAVSLYNDWVPGAMLWPMRLIVTGIFLALSVLLLAAGAWRLRTAVAKR